MKEDGIDEPRSILNSGDTQIQQNKPVDLRFRLREYSLRIIRLYDSFPKSGAVHVITHQLLRCGTSPGAQYREASRAKSDADFVSKIEGALQKLEESDYWLDLLVASEFIKKDKLQPLIDETNELIAIFVSIALKAKARKKKT